MKLPLYKSHKEVHAAEIVRIVGDEISLAANGKNIGCVKAEPNMFARYTPVQGDYYVVYPDGYKAISPKKAFEEGYTLA